MRARPGRKGSVDSVDAPIGDLGRGQRGEKIGDNGEEEKQSRLIVTTAGRAEKAALIGRMAFLARRVWIRRGREPADLIISGLESGGGMRTERFHISRKGETALQCDETDQGADNGARRWFSLCAPVHHA
ncbi:hypothetical protein [Methylosinus sp. C49]|uniref:hypothetical protein n=1 Tax=Methylosinus sp. C49 TaxID=2699395 RepID=UPI001379D982|nr:hypothetical protein [Methylosinus sp. C49]